MSDEQKPKPKNPAAVALGRLGGARRVPKGMATMDPARAAELRIKAREAYKRYTAEQREKKAAAEALKNIDMRAVGGHTDCTA